MKSKSYSAAKVAKVKLVELKSNVQLAGYRHFHLGVTLEPQAGQSFEDVVAQGKIMLAAELHKVKVGVQVRKPFANLVDDRDEDRDEDEEQPF